MDRSTALALFDELDDQRAWSSEEYQQYVAECRRDDEEPTVNPNRFDVRLDSKGQHNYEQDYRVRITRGSANDATIDWRIVLDAAEEHGVDYDIQNNGLELK